MMRAVGRLLLAVALVLAAAPRLAAAADAAIAPFIGEYTGRTIQAPNEPLSPRDLGIKIAAKGEDGFLLEWTTVIHDARGTRRQSYVIAFGPSSRKGIYSSAMQRDLFGAPEPLDPLKGDPYVWAHIEGTTLSVHALLISDDGGYEIQVYRRTLTPSGLSLAFTRNRNGTPLKAVYGVLDRVTH
jgi:hypothetical protein